MSGNKMGPTAHGVCNLIAGDPNCHNASDTYVGPGQYNWADGSGIHDTSKSLITAPIVDLSSVDSFCPTNNMGSHDTLPVVGFATIFITTGDSAKDSIYGYIVNAWGCDGDATIDTGNYGSPVPFRLIREQ